MKKVVFGLILTAVAIHVSAQNNPQNLAKDSRIKQVRFEENNVVPIQGKTFTTTQIEFSMGERILEVEGGDTTAWMVTIHPELPHVLFVKPTALHSNTNMTVITNRHMYYFHLVSNQHLESTALNQTYALKFIYSEPKPIHAIKIHEVPKPVNTSYRFNGSPHLVPLHVFDDGHFTYFEWAPNAPVPAILAVDEKNGKEAIVNSRQQGKYWVVQRLAPQFTLRHGGMVTSVFNTQEISRISANRRPS